MLCRRPTIHSLRIVRDSSSILTESPMTASIRRATSLRPGQFKHLIRVASVTGRLPERDVMLLWLTHTTGIRVTELALLEIGDVLHPSGAIKPELYLRADITKGCRPRNVYLTHARCLAALDAWLVVRYMRRWGLSGVDEYRGRRGTPVSRPRHGDSQCNMAQCKNSHWLQNLEFFIRQAALLSGMLGERKGSYRLHGVTGKP